jgi:uncharacterized membrane protein YgdD (TMEM256/DUF423 family)
VIRIFWVLGCGFALLAVAAGAFGAHALRERLPETMLAIFETGVRYQMYHALGLLAAALLLARAPSTSAVAAGWLFTFGIIVFSGSLYILVLSGVRTWGAVTPFGGVAMIAGWALLAYAGWRALG